jgi:peroxiredoxin/uncharacterized membrane protein YphA (DoxX/SURF4 family)
MEILLLVARVVLALVFGIAGVAKAADPEGSRRAMVGFGIPQKLATVFGSSLALVEILIAAALIPTATAWMGAIAALALLLVFCVGIAVNLARGKSPDCHCFGQLHSEPVKWSTFARNIVLLAVAGLIVVQGSDNAGMSALNWLADLKTDEVVSLILGVVSVAFVSTAVVYLRRVIRQQSTILARIDAMKKVIDEDYAEPPVERPDAAAPLEGLPIGSPAPDFSLATIDGAAVTLDNLLAYRKPVLLLFVSPHCPPCEAILPAVKIWERDHETQLRVAVVSKGTLEDNQDRVAKYGARYLLLQGESRVGDDYQAKWTPAAVIVSRYGRIASQMAFGDEPIRALVTATVAPDEARPAVSSVATNGNGHEHLTAAGNSFLKVGDRAPRFSLPDVEGNLVTTDSLVGRDTLLLFWDPKCPFCQAMSQDIRSWEENSPKRAPQLVFVAVGELEQVEAESRRFKSMFLHDREYEISKLFDTTLTPTALLIDRDGRIASPLTVGLPSVLALVGTRKALPIAPSF